MDPTSLPTSTSGRTAAPAEHAQRGAQLLDRHWPGWADKVDAQRLDLASGEDNVLGQLYGSFDEGQDELLPLDPDPTVWVDRKRWAAEHGFDLPQSVHLDREATGYAELTACWREEIARRTGGGRAA
jgi:hypothetical protein